MGEKRSGGIRMGLKEGKGEDRNGREYKGKGQWRIGVKWMGNESGIEGRQVLGRRG